MDRPETSDRVPVSAEWLAEQDRKQAAYAAARRVRSGRWEGKRQAKPEREEEVPPPSPAPPASAPSAPSAVRRPRGPIIDPRQSRLF